MAFHAKRLLNILIIVLQINYMCLPYLSFLSVLVNVLQSGDSHNTDCSTPTVKLMP